VDDVSSSVDDLQSSVDDLSSTVETMSSTPRLLDFGRGLTEAQRERLVHVLAHQPTLSPAENLEELERDTRAGRTSKWDVRCAPDEKVAWAEAARAKEMTTSDWTRDVLNAAARKALRSKGG
jgi:hypothetical protein